MMAAERRNSIGTLTGWQLLANQVANDTEPDKEDAAQQGDAAKRRLQLHSASNGNTVSDDSGMSGGAASACVTPRPHQWLYKEYKMLEEIGSGGFGRVCRARRLADGKTVVVKEINTTSLSQKQKDATMDEVLVLAKLNHPNIVKYHDCFMDHVYINIVMEYCNAGDLAGLIKARHGQLMPEAEVMSLFVQILLAIHYVHNGNVLHRDLKTSNVLITRDDSFGGMPLMKLGDFGVAKVNSAESSMASTIVGTPQYLSPEMCNSQPYGKKSDVWALGCILYELCSLTKAFDMGNGGISGIILKIMSGRYTPIPSSYSEDMQGLVGSMLKTRPEDRPSVVELLSMPYVRAHLAHYLDWARNVFQAQPQVLLANLGDLWPRSSSSSSSRPLPEHPQQPAASTLGSVGSVGSGSSFDPGHHQYPGSRPASQQLPPLPLEPQSSSPHALYAASSRAATPAGRRTSGTGGSNSSFLGGHASGYPPSISSDLMRQGSSLSNSARSGSVTPKSAAAASAAAAAVAAAGSSPQQQEQVPHSSLRPPAGPSAAHAASAAEPAGPESTPTSAGSLAGNLAVTTGAGPPGSLSGWLAGDTSLQQRMVIQQQVLASQDKREPQAQQQQQPKPQTDQALPPHAHPQQQQTQPEAAGHGQASQQRASFEQQQQHQHQRQPRISCPNPGELDTRGPRQQQQVPVGGPMPLEAKFSTSSNHSCDNLSTSWAYPCSTDTGGLSNTTSSTKASLAQEQMEGLKRLWGLKARLQVHNISPDTATTSFAGLQFHQMRDQLPPLSSLELTASMESEAGLNI